MELFSPDNPILKDYLSKSDGLLVVCYCAAWCDTCTQYRPKIEGLAHSRPEHVFVWVDIEDDPELLDDEDVENFPSILIERDGKTLFFGTMLPHINQLERLIDAMQSETEISFDGSAPQDVRSLLLTNH
jgi:thiol-disulfide isomerase/thioredoxin